MNHLLSYLDVDLSQFYKYVLGAFKKKRICHRNPDVVGAVYRHSQIYIARSIKFVLDLLGLCYQI